MNIIEAFDNALPEIPAKSTRQSYPRLDSRVLYKEHIEHGNRVIFAKVPTSDNYVRFTPQQWSLLELFDGNRNYEEIAVLMEQGSGIAFNADDVKEFASYMQDKTEFFYRTPLEKNIILKQKLGSHRHRRKKGISLANLTEITLVRWPHADDFLTKLQPYLRWVFTPWCTLVGIACFLAMGWMWAGKFGEIWRDSFEFYNFRSKGGWDIVEFWFLFGAMAFFHESAHGMTCKHFGGRVERIEFLLMYFSPTFMCDVTEIWILGERRARIATVMAGIWVDLIICFFATTIWWATPEGMLIHDFAYKVIMVTGIGVTLLNLNPLIKLDGYYMFSEIIGESELYERSGTYISGWFKKNILRLPVEVEFVPRRRRLLYITYSLLSQAYGTMLMVFVTLFAYHIMRSFSPEYAWIPGFGLGFYIFRGRLRGWMRLMKDVYLDKNDRLRAWFSPFRIAICSVAIMALLIAPLWPVFVEARFILEPSERVIVRNQVAGVIVAVSAVENGPVQPGSQLLRLKNLKLQSDAAEANAAFREASDRVVTANLRYIDSGKSEHVREEMAERNRVFSDYLSDLTIASPIKGVVVTPGLQDLVGTYVDAGTPVVEIENVERMKAIVYIPEFGVRDVRVGTRARLQLEARFMPVSGVLDSIAPTSAKIDSGLLDTEQLSGIIPPPFYVGSVVVRNDGTLREGMSGTAKLFVRRRSVAGLLGRFARDLIERRFW